MFQSEKKHMDLGNDWLQEPSNNFFYSSCLRFSWLQGKQPTDSINPSLNPINMSKSGSYSGLSIYFPNHEN